MSISEKVAKILAEQAGLNEGQITPDSTLVDDLGFDSLDSVEAVMAIEEEFEIIIDDANAENVKTVAELVALVVATIAGEGCLS